jgi:HlyD family secretion protein
MAFLKNLFKRRRLMVVVIAVVIVAGVSLSLGLFRQKAADSEFFMGTIERGSIRNVVSATGTVQAVVTVQVGSQVSGQVLALYADFNSVVKRGQLLAKIDPRNFEAQLENSKANLIAAEARVRTVEADLNTQNANLQSSKANLEATRVSRDNMKVIFKRYTDLHETGVASQNDYDNSKANYDSAEARYNQAAASVEQVLAQMNATRAQLEQVKAQVAQAKADVERAQINLEYTSILSPVDGVVVSRSIDVGQTVAASLQAPTLFIIANDLTKMQLNANIDEADIGKISDKVDVGFTVDAYPSDRFTGKIAEVRLNPTTVQNVVTYSVIIAVDNPQLKLKPGMTANLTITVDQRENALKVPNAALRYLPPGMAREDVFKLMRQEQSGETAAPGQAPGQGQPSSEPAKTQPQAPGRQPQSDKPQERTAPPRPPSTDIPAGLSAEAAALFKQMRDPNLSPEERRPLFQKMRELPEADQQKMRESFQWSRGGGDRGGDRGGERGFGSRGFGGQGMQGMGSPGSGGPSGMVPQGPPSVQTALAPGQMWNPAEKLRFPAPRQQSTRPAIVWVLDAQKKPQHRRLVVGITDGTNTEIVSGDLKDGDKIVIGDTSQEQNNSQSNAQRSPFGQPMPMGGPRGMPGGGGGGTPRR